MPGANEPHLAISAFREEVSYVEDHQMTNLQMMVKMTGGMKTMKGGAGLTKEKKRKKSGQKAKTKKRK